MSQYRLPQLQLEYIAQHARELLQAYSDGSSVDMGVMFAQDFKIQFGLPVESDFPPLNIFIDALDSARGGMGGHFNPGPYHPLTFSHNHVSVNSIGLGQFAEYQETPGLLLDTNLSVNNPQGIRNVGSPLTQSYPASLNCATPQMATPQPTRSDAITAPIPSTAPQNQSYFNSGTELDPQNAMELSFEGGEATVEQGQVEDALAKKKKPIERKNQFFPNKPTALNLWAKSYSAANIIATITEEVDNIMKEDPSISSDYRMTRINKRRAKYFSNLPLQEKRTWETMAKDSDSKPLEFGDMDDKLAMMRNKIQVLRKDGYKAFGFPFIGIVFTSDDDTGEASATLYDCDGTLNGRPGFTTWLLQESGRRGQSIFLAQLNKYARYVHERAAAPVGNRASSVALEINKATTKAAVNAKAQMGSEWMEGLRRIPPIDGLNAHKIRVVFINAVYDRWKLAGYTDNRVPWQRIADNNDHFVQPNVLEPNVKILKPEAMGKANIRTVLQLFIKHQNNELGDNESSGLLFMPCGSGAALLPKAKRGVRAPAARDTSTTPDTALVDSSIPVQTNNAGTSSTTPTESNATAVAIPSSNSNAAAAAPAVPLKTSLNQPHSNVVNAGHSHLTTPVGSTPAIDPKPAPPMEMDVAISTSSLNSEANAAPSHSPSAPPIPVDTTASPFTPPTQANATALPPISANANAAASLLAPAHANATALTPIPPLPADTMASLLALPTQANATAPPPTPASANATVLLAAPTNADAMALPPIDVAASLVTPTASNAMASPPAPPTAPNTTALSPIPANTNTTALSPAPPLPVDATASSPTPPTTPDATASPPAPPTQADATVLPPTPPTAADAMVSALPVGDAALVNADAPVLPASDIAAGNLPDARNASVQKRPMRASTPKAVAGAVKPKRVAKRKADAQPENQPTRKSTRLNTDTSTD